MKKRVVLTLTVLGALWLVSANAQLPTKYQIAISGVAYTTNSSGRIITQPISNHTLMQEVATADGTSDFSGWGLAYHVGGSDLGDTIDIIDRNTGATLRTLYGLYFGEAFGRLALLSGSGQQMKRLEYIYTDQNSHSLGSALLTTYYWFNSDGSTNRTATLGQMQWVVAPDSRHPTTEICTASFATLRPWTFGSH